MERLTTTNPETGSIMPSEILTESKEIEKCDPIARAAYIIRVITEKLHEYENLEITPDQVREMSRLYQEKCEEVVRLEKKLQNSVELPCKVGDIVYDITLGFSEKCKVKSIEIENEINIYIESNISSGCVEISDFVKTVFLTREEAEKALSQCRNK